MQQNYFSQSNSFPKLDKISHSQTTKAEAGRCIFSVLLLTQVASSVLNYLKLVHESKLQEQLEVSGISLPE